MTTRPIEWSQRLILFAATWLLCTELVRILRGATSQVGGLVFVGISSLLVLYCRWRAGRGAPRVKRTPAQYAWLYLPSVPAVLSVGGLVWHAFQPGSKRGIGGLAWDLLPTGLGVGVPLAALVGAYFLLARARPGAFPLGPKGDVPG